jgi:hypothetical protein
MGRTPVKPNEPIALANQITTLNGVIELPLSDTTTGPLPWVAALNWVSARCKSPCNGTLRPLPFLAA